MQYDLPQGLPQPDALSAAHSAAVDVHIRGLIDESGGAISFAQFMHEALYAPGLGYYSAGSTKFGAAGDFVTAPEVSSVFGKILSTQIAEVLANLNDGEILEFGAGSGKLAVDMMLALEAADAMPASYLILEVSPQLRERQEQRFQDTAPHLQERVQWISELPEGFVGVIVANEVLDAMPVERFRQGASLQQQTVTLDGDGFAWGLVEAPERLQAAAENIRRDLRQPISLDYVSELSLAAPSWVADVSACLHKGAIFLFDYGVPRREYYAADRDGGWLRCHFRHHAHSDPLILPGIQDITSWVDFTAIAEAAAVAELDILGYQSQAEFLLGGGLEGEMQGFEKLSSKQQLRLSGEIKTLTLPGEMGENFKCLGLGRGEVNAPSAFQFADRTRTL